MVDGATYIPPSFCQIDNVQQGSDALVVDGATYIPASFHQIDSIQQGSDALVVDGATYIPASCLISGMGLIWLLFRYNIECGISYVGWNPIIIGIHT